jgi:hypothetical protein
LAGSPKSLAVTPSFYTPPIFAPYPLRSRKHNLIKAFSLKSTEQLKLSHYHSKASNKLGLIAIPLIAVGLFALAGFGDDGVELERDAIDDMPPDQVPVLPMKEDEVEGPIHQKNWLQPLTPTVSRRHCR